MSADTKRLYQQDSYAKTFESRVVSVEPADAGRSEVVLEHTLFYPTSGGQPHDTGVLAEARVVDVYNRNGTVVHLVEGLAPNENAVVRGIVEWSRRYRHMQRHTAQHLLSQAFLRANDAFETRSVSLTSPVCTLDLAGEPTDNDLRDAEHIVTDAVYAGFNIRAFEVDESDIDNYPLRRPPKVSGTIRLVQMGEWEVSACGGTHLRASTEAGPIKILRSERVKGGLTRVYFCSGLEAIDDYRLKHRVAYGLSNELSTQVEAVPDRFAALQQELRDLIHTRDGYRTRVATLLAEKLVGDAEPTPTGRVVRYRLSADDAALLRPLAQALSEYAGPQDDPKNDIVALLGVATDDKAQLIFARGEDAEADMNKLLQEVLPLVDGRGGGRPSFAQGGGPRQDGLSEALVRAERRLRQVF
ncbi:MAG: DHHA1 domain-containing protein [Trueperaceae bacterium]|nr:DHHA1 domain-containing protein [Trueperaceae bacterium]